MTGQSLLISLVEAQKGELEKLKTQPLIVRDAIQAGKALLAQPLIKVVLGPRRSGKSTFARQILDSHSYAYLNFDDENLLKLLRQQGTQNLERALREVYGEFQFLLFDEVQNLEGWQILSNRLQRRGLNMVLTGSNANLLSHELATHLTGRHAAIEILPFSFAEFRRACPRATLDHYLAMGGYPEVVLALKNPQPYLQTLANATILKDIVARFHARQPTQILSLYGLLNAQFGQQYTISKLARTLQFSSKTTLEKYLGYLKSAYLVLELQRYSHKFKEQLKAPRKSYVIDLGFVNPVNSAFDDSARRFENLVFLGMMRKISAEDQRLYYYRTDKGLEVDFVMKAGHQVKALVQAAYVLERSDTFERETAALAAAGAELDCKELLIVTRYPVEDVSRRKLMVQGRTIKVVGAEEFLDQGGLQSSVRGKAP